MKIHSGKMVGVIWFPLIHERWVERNSQRMIREGGMASWVANMGGLGVPCHLMARAIPQKMAKWKMWKML